MKGAMHKIIEDIDLNEHPHSIFSTEDANRVEMCVVVVITKSSLQHVSDRYFVESVDKIRFFYEEGVFDKNGQLTVDKQQAFNKIGHGFVLFFFSRKKVSFSITLARSHL